MGAASDTVKRFVDVWHTRDREAFAAMVTDDFAYDGPGGLHLKGREAARQLYEIWNVAFPDNRVTILKECEQGNSVAQQASFAGTNSGAMKTPDGQTIPPTGKKVDVPFAAFSVVNGDKLQSLEHYFDQVELLSQLGLMPQPAGATV
jgi:steroid delta-isomerase-like uncharacterized protein